MILTNPWLLLGVLLVSYDLFPWLDADVGVFHPMWLFTMLLTGSLVFHARRSGAGLFAGFRWTWADTLMACFVALVALSLLMSNIEEKERIVRYIFAAMLVPYWYARLADREGVSIFAYAVPVLSAGVMIFTLGGIAYMGEAALIQERVQLFWGLPANQAFSMDMGLLALSTLSILLVRLPAGRTGRIVLLSGMFLAVVTVTLLGARAVLVSTLLVTVTALALARWVPFRVRLGYLVLFACAISAALAVVPPEKRWFYSQLWDTHVIPRELPRLPAACKIKDNSMAIRTILYREAIDAFEHAPLTGIGVGRFGYYSCYYDYGGELNSPHSTILHALSELGVAGGGIYVALMAMLVYWVVRQMARRPVRGNEPIFLLGPMFLFFVIVDQMASSYLTNQHYYLLAGMIVVLRKYVADGGPIDSSKT